MGKYRENLQQEVIMKDGGVDMDVWKEQIQQDVSELKSNQNQIRNEQLTINYCDVTRLKD